MKILHIHDQAGVACILAKFQKKEGARTRIISLENSDTFGIKKYYKNNENLDIKLTKQNDFYNIILLEANNYDIIHIHSVYELVYRLRKKYGNKKKIILHYHGSEIREGNKQISTNFKKTVVIIRNRILNRIQLLNDGYGYQTSLHNVAQTLADKTLVATPDLLNLCNEETQYLPNPVDTDLFNNFDHTKYQKNNQIRAITMKTRLIDISTMKRYLKKNNMHIDLCVHDRTTSPVDYQYIPDLLRKYNTYIDIRFINGSVLENFSKTALESLACGLNVIDYKLKTHTGLPKKHNPEHVNKILFEVYNQL